MLHGNKTKSTKMPEMPTLLMLEIQEKFESRASAQTAGNSLSSG